MEKNAELLEQCCSVVSKERKEHMRTLVAKARAHFAYSKKTIAQDILRPLLKAYAKHIALNTATIAPRILLHEASGIGPEGGVVDDERNATVRWDL